MRCAIWYHLYNLKNVKNTHGVVLLLVKLQAFPRIQTEYEEVLRISLYSVRIREKACNFTKSNTPPWVYFTFLNCTNGTKWRNASRIYIHKMLNPLSASVALI